MLEVQNPELKEKSERDKSLSFAQPNGSSQESIASEVQEIASSQSISSPRFRRTASHFGDKPSKNFTMID
jgi:hypothetical protein